MKGAWRGLLVLVSWIGAGCDAEPRVVSARGGLYGLPGAETGVLDEGEAPTPGRASAGPWDGVLRAFPGYEADAGGETDATGLRRTNPDGSVALMSRSPGDVMYHVMTTLEKKEYGLLFDQVLAEAAKAEYRRRARDPYEAVEFLAKHKEDIAALFATFPMGDQTPGVRLEPIGRNAFRLRAPVAMAQELRFHVFEVVIEEGRFRLLMIR